MLRKGRKLAFKVLVLTYILAGLSCAVIIGRILMPDGPEDPAESVHQDHHWGSLPDVLLCVGGAEPEFLFTDVRLEADEHQEEEKIYSLVSDGQHATSADIHNRVVPHFLGQPGACLSWITSVLYPTSREWNDVHLRASFRAKEKGGTTGPLYLILVGAASEGGLAHIVNMSVESYKLKHKAGVENSFRLHKSYTEWEHLMYSEHGLDRVSNFVGNLAMKRHFNNPVCLSTPLVEDSKDYGCDPDLDIVDLSFELLQRHPVITRYPGKDVRIFRLLSKVVFVMVILTFVYMILFSRLTPGKRNVTSRATNDMRDVSAQLVE